MVVLQDEVVADELAERRRPLDVGVFLVVVDELRGRCCREGIGRAAGVEHGGGSDVHIGERSDSIAL